MRNDYTLDEKTIKAIEKILAQGDRIELTPVRESVKIMIVKRKELHPEKIK